MGSSTSVEYSNFKHTRLYQTVEIYNNLVKYPLIYSMKYLNNISVEQWLELYTLAMNEFINYQEKINEAFENNLHLMVTHQGKGDNKFFTYAGTMKIYIDIIILIINHYFNEISHKYTIKILNFDRIQAIDTIKNHHKEINILNVDILSMETTDNDNVAYLESSLSYLKHYRKKLERVYRTEYSKYNPSPP